MWLQVVDIHRHCDDTRDDYDHADVAVTVWTSDCVRGYARFMLAVWAGRGAQAASCLVILLSAAERATDGATNRSPLYSRKPSAQPMAQPIAGRFILDGRARNLWRNE